MDPTPVTIGSAYVIDTLRAQLADAHWQITLLRAELAQANAQIGSLPDLADPPDLDGSDTAR